MVSKTELQSMLQGKDDYTKLDILNRFLKNADSIDLKKFILLLLAEINESRTFYKDAAKNIDAAAEMSITYREKLDYYMKEVELLVRGGDFVLAEKIFLKALDCGSHAEKQVMKVKYSLLYEKNALVLEKEGKSRKALDYYERLFSMDIPYDKKSEIKEKILKIYEKVGRIREYNLLKNREIKKPESNTKSIEPGSFDDLGIGKL